LLFAKMVDSFYSFHKFRGTPGQLKMKYTKPAADYTEPRNKLIKALV